MRWCIGDYMADTTSLTLAQHGAHCLAIMAYFKKRESLEDDELKGICGSEFKRVSRFFIWCEGRWHHKRIDEELSWSIEHMKKMHDRSMKGVEARRKKGLLPVRKIKYVSQGDLNGKDVEEMAQRVENGIL